MKLLEINEHSMNDIVFFVLSKVHIRPCLRNIATVYASTAATALAAPQDSSISGSQSSRCTEPSSVET